MAITLRRFLGNGSGKLLLFVEYALPTLIIEQANVAAALLQLLDDSTPRLRAFMHADRNRGVDLRPGDFLEQLGAFALGCKQKGVEFALCEQNRSPKLIECEIGSCLDRFTNLGLAAGDSAAIVKAR